MTKFIYSQTIFLFNLSLSWPTVNFWDSADFKFLWYKCILRCGSPVNLRSQLRDMISLCCDTSRPTMISLCCVTSRHTKISLCYDTSRNTRPSLHQLRKRQWKVSPTIYWETLIGLPFFDADISIIRRLTLYELFNMKFHPTIHRAKLFSRITKLQEWNSLISYQGTLGSSL